MNKNSFQDRNGTQSVEEITCRKNMSVTTLPFSLRRGYSKKALRGIRKRAFNRLAKISMECLA